jgi:hypothetical protein
MIVPMPTGTSRTRPRQLDRDLSAAVMVAADVFASRRWCYGGAGAGAAHTPDVEEIAKMIISLVERCERFGAAESVRVSSGRFLVERRDGVASVWMHLGDLGGAGPDPVVVEPDAGLTGGPAAGVGLDRDIEGRRGEGPTDDWTVTLEPRLAG